MIMSNKESSKSKTIFLECASLVVVSFFIGALVGLIGVALAYILKGVEAIYKGTFENKTGLILYAVFSTLAAALFYFLMRFFKLSAGNGRAVLAKFTNDEYISWYEYPLLLIGFFVSFFAGMPVGQAEICQTAGVVLTKKIYRRVSIDDEDAFEVAAGSSFGAAFVSPLAGLAYSLEKKRFKVSPLFVLKAALSAAVASASCYLIRHLFDLQGFFVYKIEAIGSFSWNSLIVYIIMGIILAFASGAIVLLTRKARLFFEEKHMTQKVSGFATVAIFLVAFLCTLFGLYFEWKAFSLAGYDGSRIFSLIDHFKSVGLIIGTNALWLFFVLLLPHSNLLGGKVIPMMTLGMLFGLCFSKYGVDRNVIGSDESILMISVAMFSFYGVIYKKPITAFALALTFTKWANVPYEILPLIFAMAPGYLLNVFLKIPGFDEITGSEIIG